MAKRSPKKPSLTVQLADGIDDLAEELYLTGNATGGTDPAGCAYANGIITAVRRLLNSRCADNLSASFWEGARRSQERCYDQVTCAVPPDPTEGKRRRRVGPSVCKSPVPPRGPKGSNGAAPASMVPTPPSPGMMFGFGPPAGSNGVTHDDPQPTAPEAEA